MIGSISKAKYCGRPKGKFFYGRPRHTPTIQECDPSEDVDPEYAIYRDDLVAFAEFMGNAWQPLIAAAELQRGVETAGENHVGRQIQRPEFCMKQYLSTRPSDPEETRDASDFSRDWVIGLKKLRCQLRVLTDPLVSKHPNIMRLIDVDWRPSEHPLGLLRPSIHLEIAPLGTIAGFQLPDVFSFSWRSKIAICKDVAAALIFLHSHGVCHGDVNTGNVFLFPPEGAGKNGYYRAKISDFDRSTFACDSVDGKLPWNGSKIGARWPAPEVLNERLRSSDLLYRADVYSFGFFFWHVLLDGGFMNRATFRNRNAFAEDPYLCGVLASFEAEPKDFNVAVASRIMSASICFKAQDRAPMHELLGILEEEIFRFDQGAVLCMVGTSSISANTQNELKHEATYQESLEPTVSEEKLPEPIFDVNFCRVPNKQIEKQIYHGLLFSIKQRHPHRSQRGTAETYVQLSVCCFSGFGRKLDQEKALAHLTEAAHRGSHKAMAVMKRMLDATGRKPKKLGSEQSLADEVENAQAEMLSKWLVNGALHHSLLALDDCYTHNEETWRLGKESFRHYMRPEDPASLRELEFIAEITEAIQNADKTIDRDGYTRRATESLDETGDTHLHRIASAGRLEHAKFLMNLGCCVDATNAAGETPLLLAMKFLRTNMTILLLSSGANPSMPAARGCSPLHFLASFHDQDLERISHALSTTNRAKPQFNIDCLCEDYYGARWHFVRSYAHGSPLTWAVARNNVEAARVLLNLGADPLAVDNMGKSPVWHAVQTNAVAMFKLFAFSENPWVQRVREDLGSRMQHYIKVIIFRNDFQRMVELGDQFQAASKEMVDLFEFLGPSDDDRALLLWHCVECGLLEEAGRILQSKNLQKFIDVKPDGIGETCLSRAIHHFNRKLFDLLLKHGPDLRVKHGVEELCYLMLAIYKIGDPEDKRYFMNGLIASGADVNERDRYGYSALERALCDGDIAGARILHENGAVIFEWSDKKDITPLGRLIVSAPPQPKDVLDLYFSAVGSEKKATREWVVDKRNMRSALHVAAAGTWIENSVHESWLIYLLSIFSDKRYLDFQDDSGNTALHLAANSGNPAALTLLLEADADRSLSNSEGDTPLAIIQRRPDALARLALCTVFVEGSNAGKWSVLYYDDITRNCLELLKNHHITMTMADRSREYSRLVISLLLAK